MKHTMLIVVLFSAFLSTHSFGAQIRVSGGASPMANIFKRIKDAFEKKTGHVLILNEQSPELALQALDKGEIEVASAGLQWSDWLKLCKTKNIKIDEAKPYRYSSVGRDSILVFINKASSVGKLSFEQLEKIFTGKATSWKEFGGADKPIHVVFGKGIAGTNTFFSKTVMNGADYRKDLTVVEKADDIAEAIGKDADAIGFGPVGIDTNKFGIKIVETPEIFRPILFAFLSVDQSIVDLKSFIGSDEGQALIKR